MPDPSHVGRRYQAPGQVVDPDRCRALVTAIAGTAEPFEPDTVPPTAAAVYCLYPTLLQLFGDPEVGINLAGLVHGEQSFEWPEPIHPGDVVDAEAEIATVESRRNLTFVGIDVSARRPADGATVCRGRALLLIRG